MIAGGPNKSDDFSLPTEPLSQRIVKWVTTLFWLVALPLAAAVAGLIFLNATIGMGLGTWVATLTLTAFSAWVFWKLDL
jgi:hypothetical protein